MGNHLELGHLRKHRRRFSSTSNPAKECTVIQVFPPKDIKGEDLLRLIRSKWGSGIKKVQSYLEFQRFRFHVKIKNTPREVVFVPKQGFEDYSKFPFNERLFPVVYLLDGSLGATYCSNRKMDFENLGNLPTLETSTRQSIQTSCFCY